MRKIINGLLILLVITGAILIREQLKPKQEIEQVVVDLPEPEKIEDSYELPPKEMYIEACTDSTFKSYMDYLAITNRSSEQWKLQQEAETDISGIRLYKGFFMVALTKRYGNVGDIVVIDFEGHSIYAIIGDTKDAGHDECSSTRDGSMVEFIIDQNHTDQAILRSGNFNLMFKGKTKGVMNYGRHIPSN